MSRARYCRCGSQLARDNADMLCSPCQRMQRRDQAPEVPPEFWHSALIGPAVASVDLGRVIRMYRFHPFHGQPLRQSVVAGWLHVSQATLSRIERGKRHLTIDEIDYFARALGMHVALRWVHQNPTKAGEDVEPISRRGLLGAGAGTALGLSSLAATTAPASTREIDPELVSHWMKLLRVLDRHDAMFGPHEVLATVRHQLELIAEHREIARGELRTQLLRVESRWSGFASWLGHDAGNSFIGEYWADRASRLAQAAGYYDMVAWMLMRQSRWAAMRPDPRRAIRFADAARLTPATSHQIRVLCALREAQGHALANDATSCERSLADAYELLDDAGMAETPQEDLGTQYVTPASVLADEARCWLRLRPRKSIAMFEDALRLWPNDRTRDRGVLQARLALAWAAANEPDRAAAEGVKALNIAQTTKSDVTVHELKQLDRQLAASDVPAAADFCAAFAAV